MSSIRALAFLLVLFMGTIWRNPFVSALNSVQFTLGPEVVSHSKNSAKLFSGSNRAMALSASADDIIGENATQTMQLRKAHHVTVAMIPPPKNAPHVWKVVSQMRRQLLDPGYFRWPPHANLIYPFLSISPKNTEEEIDTVLEQLHSATRQIEPFPVHLHELGTFGGKHRGVLWLKPDSPFSEPDQAAPLLALHKKLEEAFPMCKDQTKGGSFTPHMTLSHFANLQDALEAKEKIENDYQQEMEGENLSFIVDRIYLLHREGDEGQFLRVAEIGLGANSHVDAFRPPQAFEEMPLEEDEWVHEERMKLKARRNGNTGRSRGGRRKQQRRRSSREPRAPDAPEVIAAKREARKEKRERLEREQQAQQEGA